MRFIVLILVMMMVSGTAQAKSHPINCNYLKKMIDVYLKIHSSENMHLSKQLLEMPESAAKDVVIEMHTKSSEKALTTSTQFATIYIAKCK